MPLGYRIVERDNKKTYESDPETWPKVQEIIDLYKSGQYSIRDLVRHAEQIGLRSKRGGALSVSSVHFFVNHKILS